MTHRTSYSCKKFAEAEIKMPAFLQRKTTSLVRVTWKLQTELILKSLTFSTWIFNSRPRNMDGAPWQNPSWGKSPSWRKYLWVSQNWIPTTEVFLACKNVIVTDQLVPVKKQANPSGDWNMLPKSTALDTFEIIPPQMNCKSFMDLYRAAAFLLL